jgi:hypothetical protein
MSDQPDSWYAGVPWQPGHHLHRAAGDAYTDKSESDADDHLTLAHADQHGRPLAARVMASN